MYNETYDDYIRSILGYQPIDTFENNFPNYKNQNINYNIFSNINATNTTSNIEIENLYPEIYKIIYPMICKKCDNIENNVTEEDIQNIVNEIYSNLEENTNLRTTENLKSKRETRQPNNELQDLIKILLIREILQRRRPPQPGPRPPIPPPYRPRF